MKAMNVFPVGLLSFLAILGPLVAFPSALAAPGPGWTVEPVLAFSGSSAPQIAIDSRGLPHVLACPPGEAWYGSRDANGVWSLELVARTVGGGICGRLVIGLGDVPYLTLSIPPTWDPAHFYLAIKAGTAWQFLERPRNYVELAVDASGTPHLSGAVRTSSTMWTVRYSSLVGGSWTDEDVESFPNPSSSLSSSWGSLTLDMADNPHLLYYESVRGDVRYAFRNETGWHVEVVEHIGALNVAGREGSLALDSAGNPHATYTVRTGPKTGEVRYATAASGAWSSVVVSRPPPTLGGGAFSPSIALVGRGPAVAYVYVELIESSPYVASQDLVIATSSGGTWSEEVVVDGINDQSVGFAVYPQFPLMVADMCDRPHIAFYYNRNAYGNTSESGVYYATKGEPCGGRSVSVGLDPDTLNLKSKGKWVTAYVTANGASVESIDAASLTLNGVPTAKWSYESDTLVAKFDRQRVAATLAVGDSVEVILAGTWTDGATFTAKDAIRVIDPVGGFGPPSPIPGTPMPMAAEEPLAMPAWRQPALRT